MGLGVAGLAVFGLALWFLFLVGQFIDGSDFYTNMTIVLESLAGFSLGAESIALFARVGGGIYTKAADVGADLVGKVEAGIPEDDPRNPATIADNVGDNVGDVAGMGADLFGSYVATVLASMVLGNYIIKDMSEAGQTLDTFQGMGPILLPLVLAGVGIIASIAGTLFIRIKDNSAKEAEVQRALNTGNIFSILLTLIASWFLIDYLLPETISGMKFFGEAARDVSSTNIFFATIVGLGVGYLILSLYRVLYRHWQKASDEYCTKLIYRGSDEHHRRSFCWDDIDGFISTSICSCDLGFICISRVLWSCDSCVCNDGNDSHAVGH